MTAANDDELFVGLMARFDYDGTARQIVESYLPTIPAYSRIPDSILLGEILGRVRENLEVFTRCMMEDRDPSPAELDVVRESATERGREGMPLQDLLQAYRLGARFCWQSLVETAKSPEEHRVLLKVADRILRYVDTVSAVVTQVHLDERENLVSEHERSARALMDGILDSLSSLDDLREAAERGRFVLSDRYRPFALSEPGASARDHARMAIELRTRGILTLTEGDRIAGLLLPETDPATLARPRAVLALGDVVSRPQLTEGLETVRLEVETARHLGRTGTVTARDLLPDLLLTRSPKLSAALRERVLGPLEEYARKRSPELLETIEVFIDVGLDRRAAAQKLVVHTNTLDYRLRRVEQLTGLELGDPESLTLLVLALKARRLEPTA